MSIVVNPASRPQQWIEALRTLLPDEEVHLWPDVDRPEQVDYVAAWQMTADELATFPNLAAVFSLGAGVDQWLTLQDHDQLKDVPVVRLVDPAMSDEMAAYALHWVVHFQRGFDQLAELQRQHRFEQPDYIEAESFPVGILGYGNIGRRLGDAFAHLGHPINAWSRSGGRGQPDPHVTHFIGTDDLDAFLGASKAVVNVLPNTAETAGLLDSDRLASFAQDSMFVNMGRGTVVDEAELIDALDRGPLRVAVLDVTDPEPPDPSSPLFDHPAVVLTGHTAGATLIPSASRLIAANIARLRRGEAAFPLLDPSRGY